MKGLTKRAPCFESTAPENYNKSNVWELDPTHRLKSVENVVGERMADEKNIKTVANLRAMRGENKKELLDNVKVKGISMQTIEKVIEEAHERTCPGSRLETVEIDHRLADNPYLSLHGEENWREKY